MAPSIDIEIRWGTSILLATHLSPPRSVTVGEQSGCDCLLPAALLGVRRAPIVIVDPSGSTWLCVLPNASASAPLDEARARPHPEIRGARLVPFPPGSRVSFEIGSVAFRISHDPEGPEITRRIPHHGTTFHVGLSLAAHAALLVASAFALAPMRDTFSEDAYDTTRVNLAQWLVTGSERELDEPRVESVAEHDPDERPLAQSRCSEENGGSMGEPSAGRTRSRYGVEGPADNPDPHVGRWLGANVEWIPGIGITPQDLWGDTSAPVAPWGRDDSLGNDTLSARGNLWGDALGPSFGSPGVGVGRDRLCETCGDRGRGTSIQRNLRGGATPTESACSFSLDAAGHGRRWAVIGG